MNQELLVRVEELEKLNSLPREVFVAKEVDREVRVVSRIGDRADALLDSAARYSNMGSKQLLFSLLFYHGKYVKERKRNFERSHSDDPVERLNKAYDVDYIGKLYAIYLKIVRRLVKYLLEVFRRSVKLGSTMNTYHVFTRSKSNIIFQNNVKEIKKSREETLYSLIGFYME